jgi:hypothetical protein
MPRDVVEATEDAMRERVIRPVVLAVLDFSSDAIAMWTGPGLLASSGYADPALNGRIFDPDKAFLDIGDISEDQGIGGPLSIVAKGEALETDALRQIVRDRREWRGRKAYIWFGLLDDDDKELVGEPVRIKTGVMTEVKTSRGQDYGVSITIDADLRNSSSAEWRWVDHPAGKPGDTLTAFVFDLANKPQGLESADIRRITQPTMPQPMLPPGWSWGM